MSTVADLLEKKGAQVLTVAPDTSVYEAIKLMAEQSAGTVVVVEDDQMVGIVSERDFIRKVALKDRCKEDRTVAEIMSRKVTFVTKRQTLDECMAIMTQKRIRHLPVLSDGHLAGIVSMGDIIKHMISEKDLIIRNFEQYIYQGDAPAVP